MSSDTTPQQLLEYWYSKPVKQCWFNSTPELDQQIRQQYENLWARGVNDELDSWKNSAEGCLALVILFDQLPLNMFRSEARSFSTEQKAVALCKFAIEQGFEKELNPEQLAFLYMPLMHSEKMEDQDLSVNRFEAAGLTDNAKFAQHHRQIIEEFGRFPHRNAILGRASTDEEIDYLSSDEAFLG